MLYFHRPLPDELVRYAREDTHHLLYIYDRLHTELLERGNNQSNLLRAVLQRSNDICKKVSFAILEQYEKSGNKMKICENQRLCRWFSARLQ